MLIPVRIEGQYPLWFALDTGIAHTAIDRNVAAKLGLKPSSGDSHPASTPVRVDLGAETFDTRLEILEMGAAEYQRACDQPLDGLLGMDFFENFIVTLDYDAAVVSLRNRTDVIHSDHSLRPRFMIHRPT